MEKSETIGELAKALVGFHSEVKQPKKDKDNPFFKSKFVPLENVVEAITTTATKHGLSFVQYPLNEDNKVGIATLLLHSSGEWVKTEPIFTTPAKQDPQATGSAISYLRRYSLSAVFGITSDEDDDGNLASYMETKANYPPKQANKPTPTTNENGPKMISDAQVKAIGTKTSIISKNTDVQQAQVYKSAASHLKIGDKSTRELTASEASKVIEYLTTLE